MDAYEPDLIVLAGYLVVIPPEMIKKYKNRIINIHPSLIPSFCGTGYYGLKVHEEALARGVKVVGATVHFVDEGTDTGPIILQKAVEVKRRYAGSASAQSDGAGGMEDPSTCDRSDRERKGRSRRTSDNRYRERRQRL